jgi:membrane fusion protein (multidrug efflux system)
VEFDCRKIVCGYKGGTMDFLKDPLHGRLLNWLRAFRGGFAGVLAALGVLILSGCEKPKPQALPPLPVQVMTVQPQTVPITKTWVGTSVGEVDVSVSAQVSGYLLEQVYVNGTFVNKGDVLFQIDPRPFQAALQQAQGTLAQAEAQLKAALLTAQRANELYAKQVISQEQFDDQTQAYFAAKATAEAAQAAVDQANLNLGFTTMTSPISGIASIATAQVGNLVGPSSGVLASVTQVDPIKVNFSAAEQEYLNFIQQFFDDPNESPVAQVEAGAKAREQPMRLVLTLANGTVYPREGSLIAINNAVTENTGTIELQGSFPNPGNLLRPGQFALVSAIVREQPNAIVVPQRAVGNLQGQSQMAVVGADNKVSIRNVVPGEQIGSDWIIKSGINPGDRIVVEGLQKVKDGMVVNPTPYTETTQEANSLANQLPGAKSGIPDMPAETPQAPVPTPPAATSPAPAAAPSASPEAPTPSAN